MPALPRTGHWGMSSPFGRPDVGEDSRLFVEYSARIQLELGAPVLGWLARYFRPNLPGQAFDSAVFRGRLGSCHGCTQRSRCSQRRSTPAPTSSVPSSPRPSRPSAPRAKNRPARPVRPKPRRGPTWARCACRSPRSRPWAVLRASPLERRSAPHSAARAERRARRRRRRRGPREQPVLPDVLLRIAGGRSRRDDGEPGGKADGACASGPVRSGRSGRRTGRDQCGQPGRDRSHPQALPSGRSAP